MQASFAAALDALVPEAVHHISRTLEAAGHRCWLVGGSVRDVLFAVQQARAPAPGGDWDLASDARPEQAQKLFKKVLPTGIQHGTVTIVLSGQHYELTTLRGEKGHSDGRRPDEVYFVDDLREDLARRDFTVNAIAFGLADRQLHDPFDGIGDLERGLLRAVGQPEQRFAEDGLRVLRGARFCSTLGLVLEPATRGAMRPSLESFGKVSLERVRDEWWKALGSARPSACFRVQLEEGLLAVTAPSLLSNASPNELEETWCALDAAKPDALRRLALLCALGLPGSASERGQGAAALATHLRLANLQKTRLSALVSHPELPAEADAALVRVWLARVGRKDASDVLSFIAELPSKRRSADLRFDAFVESAQRQLASGAALGLSELALTGKDLLGERLLVPGPAVGRVLGQLLDQVLEDPGLNDRTRLLALATELCRV